MCTLHCNIILNLESTIWQNEKLVQIFNTKKLYFPLNEIQKMMQIYKEKLSYNTSHFNINKKNQQKKCNILICFAT